MAEDKLKIIYGKLVGSKDPEVKSTFGKYSYNDFRKQLETNVDAVEQLADYLQSERIIGSGKELYNLVYTPTPSVPEKVPAKEVKPLTPLEQTRELARKGGLGVVPISGTQTLTDLTREQVEVPQEQAPVGVLAPEPFEPQTIEQIAAKQAVTPAPPVKKETLRDRLKEEGKGLIGGIVDYGKGLYTQLKRGLAQGEAIQSVNMGDLREVAQGKDTGKINYELLAKANKAVKEYGQTNTDIDLAKKEGMIKDAWDLVKALPGVTIESLASLGRSGIEEVATGTAIGGGAGSVVPGLGTAAGAGIGATAGMIQAGRNMEYFGSLMQELEAKGIDITNPAQIKEGLKRYGKEADDLAITRANVIAGVETLIPVAGVAATSIGKRMGANILAKPVRAVGKVLTKEPISAPLGGATGELSAQIASGQEINPQEILLEAGGEGAATVAAATRALKEKVSPTPPPPPSGAVPSTNRRTNPDGSVTITVNSLEEVPEQYRDRARQGMKGTASTLPFGLGKKTEISQWNYTLTPEENEASQIEDVGYEVVEEPVSETAPETEYAPVTEQELEDYFMSEGQSLSPERRAGVEDDIRRIQAGEITLEDLEDENYRTIVEYEMPDQALADLNEQITAIQAAPAEGEVVAEEVPVAPAEEEAVVETVPTEEAPVAAPVAETETKPVTAPAVSETPPLRDVESTAKALEGVDKNAWGSDKGLTENFYTTDVDGYAIKKPITNPSSVTIDGVDFHIAKVDGDWKVIEKKSGLEISTGKTSNTKSAAIEDATMRLAQNGGA
jgi:hypothetical protein